MSDLQIFGLGLAAIIGIGIFAVVLVLVFGAMCLHWTTGILHFKKRSFRKAFGAHILIVVAPSIGSGGAHLLSEYSMQSANPAWPFLLGAVLLGLLGGLFPVLILKYMYKQTFTKSLIAYVVAVVVEISVVIVLCLAIAAVLFAVGIAGSKTG